MSDITTAKFARLALEIACNAACVLLSFAVFALPLPGKSTDDPQPLKATTEIVSQKYCLVPGKRTFDFAGEARVRFTNPGTRKLIVAKTMLYPNYSYVVAHDEKSLASNDWEWGQQDVLAAPLYVPYVPMPLDAAWNILPTLPTSNDSGARMSATSDDSWIFVSHNEYFEIELYFGIENIPLDKPPKIPFGNHVVQFGVSTWPGTEQSAEVFRKKWEEIGDLAFRPIKTEPVAFSLEPQLTLKHCK